MPGDDHPTEEPTAAPGKEQAAAEPHADIVARLLEYQRRLREETGGEPAPFKEREAPPPIEAEQVSSEPTETSEDASEPEQELSQPDLAPPAADDEGSQPPDARTLKERIDRLDETLERISSMLPLLKGETKHDPES